MNADQARELLIDILRDTPGAGRVDANFTHASGPSGSGLVWSAWATLSYSPIVADHRHDAASNEGPREAIAGLARELQTKLIDATPKQIERLRQLERDLTTKS